MHTVTVILRMTPEERETLKSLAVELGLRASAQALIKSVLLKYTMFRDLSIDKRYFLKPINAKDTPR